jgi:hypothetical protein
MYTDMGKVVTEPLLHIGPDQRIECPSWCAEDLGDAGRYSGRRGPMVCEPMNLLVLVVVAGTWRALHAAAPLDCSSYRYTFVGRTSHLILSLPVFIGFCHQILRLAG